MALKTWLASLKGDVSGVQAPIHAGSARYVTETPDVSGVSGSSCMAVGDTADTAAQNQTYQPQPAWALGCTGDTGDTCTKINVEAHAVNELLSGDLLAVDAKAYYAHHFNCPQCIAAGTGIRYDRRCAAGLALWSDYNGVSDSQTQEITHGQA